MLVLILAFANSHPIFAAVPPTLDGDFREWSDFGHGPVRVFSCAERIYIYIDFGAPLVFQTGNGVTVYIDTDGDSSTGFSRSTIGAEFRWDAGMRSGVAYKATGEIERTIRHTDLDWITAPVMDSGAFEISMARQDSMATNCAVLVERHESVIGMASAPHGNKAFRRSVSPDRSPHADFRLVAYNVLADGLMTDNSARREIFDEEFRVLQPDVVCLTEIYRSGEEVVRARLAEVLPYMQYASGERSWDSRIVSRHPILFEEANGYFHCARVRSGSGDVDVMVLTAHLRSGDWADIRGDQLVAMGDFIARLRGGLLPGVPSDLPVVVAGDLNLVRNDAVNFTNFQNVTALRPLRALHLDRNDDYTWRNDSVTSDYSPGRLDYILSGAGLVALHAFVYESDVPPSDHLPVIADFAVDADLNGLADRWERTLFGSIGRDGAADQDADGWRNLAEQRLGTDPRDPESRPYLRTSPEGGGVALMVSGHGNGNVGFRLWRSGDLRTWQRAGRWAPGAEAVPVDGPGRQFYRLMLDE